MSEPDYRSLARFRRSLRAFLHFSEQAVKAEGLTPSQYQLLLMIKGFDGERPPNVGDVAEWLKLRHHSAVELVDRAEAGGLVSRSVDAEDHRRQLVSLTALGDERLAALSTLHRQELRRFREEVISSLRDL